MSTRSNLKAAAVLTLIVGIVLVVALPYQHLSIYFSFGGETVEASDAEVTRYVWTAAAAIGVMIGSLVLATFAMSRAVIWCGVIGLIAALLAAAVFTVPQDRWSREPAPNRLPENYNPCYSGSGYCDDAG